MCFEESKLIRRGELDAAEPSSAAVLLSSEPPPNSGLNLPPKRAMYSLSITCAIECEGFLLGFNSSGRGSKYLLTKPSDVPRARLQNEHEENNIVLCGKMNGVSIIIRKVANSNCFEFGTHRSFFGNYVVQ